MDDVRSAAVPVMKPTFFAGYTARIMTNSIVANGSILAHPRVVALRNRLRQSPVVRRLYRRWVARHDYEERFSRAMLEAVKPGDVVWDIGANVGLYTRRFLEQQAGGVVCFEPAPAAIRALEVEFGLKSLHADRVRIVPVALARTSGTLRFAADGSSPTNKIANANTDGETIVVPVRSGDAALREYGLPLPNLIKIDVEGFELDVLEGLDTVILSQPELRCVFVEVHFALLNERGMDNAPGNICALLAKRGFSARWLDPSHIGAVRLRNG